MKKGYTKVLIIEAIMIVFLLVNGFIVNFLPNYLLVLFLFLSLCLYKIFFDFEKDKHRNTKDIILYLIIYLLIVFIIYYAIGLITGYVKMPSYYNWYGLTTFILPTTLIVILGEFLKYQLLRKSEGNTKLIVLTTILFILVDISNAMYYADFSSAYTIVVFIGLTLLPSIGKNIFSTYTSVRTGYKPAIVLGLSLALYEYLLPILPNINEYFQSMFSLLVLTFLTFILAKILKNNANEGEEEFESKYSKRMITLAYISEVLVAFVLVYFLSGYFSYYAIAIASNSMYPTFERGSIAIIKKINENYDELEVGDIIAYKYENKIIAHRIAKITIIGENRYFYTKGDANENLDNYVIRTNMIMGTINTYIPFLGYPTVWINELLTD